MRNSYSLKKSGKENLALKSGVFSFVEGEMYAGSKPRRAIAQPSKEDVRALIISGVREHRPPLSQERLRSFWVADERARRQVAS